MRSQIPQPLLEASNFAYCFIASHMQAGNPTHRLRPASAVDVVVVTATRVRRLRAIVNEYLIDIGLCLE